MLSLANLTERIIGLLEKDPGQQIQQLARKLEVNRTFLAGHLLALENQGCVKSKKMRYTKVCSDEKENQEVMKLWVNQRI
jgi:predicted ArsR family transcriptional regulator